MDDKNKELKEQIRKEVIAELMPTYQSALNDLNVEKRIMAEKEKIFDFCFKYFIDGLALNNARRRAIEEMQQQNNNAGAKSISQ